MNTNNYDTYVSSDVTLTPLVGDDEQIVSKFELALNVVQIDGGLSFNFEYICELFDRETITRMGTHLLCLLAGIVANPQANIDVLPMLRGDEQHHLLHTLNQTQVDYDQQQLIHEMF